jgi:hypothetical protein
VMTSMTMSFNGINAFVVIPSLGNKQNYHIVDSMPQFNVQNARSIVSTARNMVRTRSKSVWFQSVIVRPPPPPQRFVFSGLPVSFLSGFFPHRRKYDLENSA